MTSKLDIADYRFFVKEGQPGPDSADDAPPWLSCEADTSDLRILNGGDLSLRLRKGTTLDQAHEIARFLNKHVEAFQYQPA